jgi:RHH-type proline utilization regulon transcriptional repressor/proline dehydrogenase/delta 1-pyrroline-5-carboxylate dehydrogenase
MGEALYRRVAEETGLACRVYAPVGGYRDLLAYLVRRILENGANTSFVHQLADPAAPEEALLADPVAQVEARGGAPNPAIPKPSDLFGPERRNSQGLDLSDRATLAALDAAFEAAWAGPHRAAPIVAGREGEGAGEPVPDPADPGREAGRAVAATPGDVGRALGVLDDAFPAWSKTPVAARAAVLRRTADLVERDRAGLMALLMREAGKTRADALAEVREAVDFCRYYAVEAERTPWRQPLPGPTGERNEMRLSGRGVFACISPWNFPLSIFLGQVAAALVTGNTVAAKPAPQTPLVAAAAVRLLLEAGASPEALALLPGGPEVGQALCADRRVAGVCFTGSTATARRIARTLLEDEARPLVPLIAETGGVNAMIVDSTALLEQVTADVIASAFQSAGQRCSALRLLCLQEDIAEPAIEMLKGAMAELRVGDPAELSTDVGPLIDQAARDRIAAYLERRREAILYTAPAAPGVGWFLNPVLVGLPAVEDLREEVFGPVLHVTTWRAGDLDRLVDRINASGYGLTLGLHSRLREAAERVRARARVGNLYINRTIIGAVVGAQPFGGEGLSGSGPKAGGPHYLLRFCLERASSEDTTSAGGDAALMTLGP